MTIANLTRDTIKEHTAGGSFERGQQYLADGAVRSLKRTDDHTIKAQVQGSDVHPYLVRISFDDGDVRSVKCTCPYHEGSWCKHIVAVLLKTLKQEDIPESESVRLRSLLRDLDRDDLLTLLEELVEDNPELVDQVRSQYARMT